MATAKRLHGDSKMAEALEKGQEAFRRLVAAGFLVLHANGTYELTEMGKQRVSSLIGHSCVIPLSQLSRLIAAMEAWLLQHKDDDSDDYALVVAVGTIMQAHGFLRMKFAGWR